ncbi:MAG: hypothetical protein RL701_7794 [Pseudomonadota bacterium]
MVEKKSDPEPVVHTTSTRATLTPKRARMTKRGVEASRPAPIAEVSPRPFIVGIGASAGGLAALETFFSAMPHESGLVFVVIAHQSATQPSLLSALLARRTRMTVQDARDGALEPNHVYVSLPGKNIAMLNGAIQVMDVQPAPGLHLPIDYFFRSLAQDQQEHAICIVLSGTGSDGTLGLRAIKGHSGMAMVQDEASADHAGMPQSAAATLLADYVLEPDRMPAQLLGYAATAKVLQPGAAALETGLPQALPKIFVLLRDRVGHDFSGYKLNTLMRRVERRMRVHELSSALEYVRLLQAEPHELDLLFQELLITVTHFFRDPPAFAALSAHLSALMAGQAELSLRVWVAGCATGEEPYSLAILALELAEIFKKPLHLQIFATDLDPSAIEFARRGCYPAGIAADVGPERLRHYFTADARGFQIVKQVRDCIVFCYA